MKSKGFTLIELIVYVAVFAILMTTITLLAIAFIENTAKNRIKKEVVSGAYSAMNSIIYEIKRANNIYTPTSIFNSNVGQLSLETSQGLPPGEEITYLDFYVDSDNKLYIKREGQNPQILISENLKVTNLEFEHLDSTIDSVRINLTVEYDATVSEYQYSYGLSSSASLRR